MDGLGTPAPPGGGWAGHGAATAGTGAPAAEAGSVRVQFEGGRRLGGCVAWDPASGLLAVELQASGGPAAAAAVAIIDPQAPEGHFVALVPPGRGGSSGEGLAALLWSPPAARRLLLAVTSSGAAFAWTMDAPAAAAAASLTGAAADGATGSGSAQPGGGGGGGGGVACVNQWYGRAAFQLPVPREEAPAASGGQARGRSLLCCRFLGSAAAAACWDAAAAPPFADRQLSAEQVCEYYRQRGLERAFARAAAPPPGAEPDWLRPGLLCVAAVTRQGQLLLALGGRGVTSGSGSAGDCWVLAPALPLPLPPPQPSALSPDAPVDVDGGSGEARLELLLADVVPTAGGSLLVAAAAATAAPHGAAAHPSSEGPHHQLLLFEVAGPPPPLLAAGGGGEQQQQQQQQAARLSSPVAALPPGAAALCLAFLPGGPAAANRLLVATGCVDGGSSALVISCSSSSRSLGGLHTWQVQPGPSLQLDRRAAPAAGATASVSAAADGASLALLLPAERRLLRLQAGHGGTGGGNGGAALSVSQPPAAASFAAVPAAGVVEAPLGLACSPNGTFAAAAQPGASALLLLPLVAQPCGAAEVEPFMLQLGKRCCAALLAGTAGGAAGWDLTAAAAAAVRRWGHPGLQATQQLVDGAVAAVRADARPQYAAAWSRLKAALLAAAAAAHPAAAADAGAAAVRADSAAREWMAAAADIFDAHLPDKAARAAAAKQGSAAIHADMRAALVKLMPARYWAVWAADFSCYLARCLLYWLRLNQKGKGGGGGGGGHDAAAATADGLAAGADAEAAAAAAAFAAEQSAGPDCLPCVRLLSDAQFYRSFSRLVSGIHQFHRLLSTLNRSKTPNSSFELIIQQLQLVQDMVVLLRALHEAFSKAQAEAAAAASPPGDAGEATSRLSPHAAADGGGYSGAWTLVCGQPARPLAWSGAAAALHKLRQQQGGSSLLARVRQHWSKAGAGEQSETVGSLLEAAAQLGLLPAQPAAGSGGSGGGGWQRGGPRPLLAEQLKRRAVALAAAEAGEGLLGGVPLPATPPQQLRWAAAEEEDSGQEGEGSQAQARASKHPGASRGRKRAAARQLAAWELERAAALGLPPPPQPPGSGGAALFEGRLDVLTGRPLSWEHGAAFAAADGGCATAELQPDAFAPGSALAWQAAYAAAAPVGGQRWKRLRLEEL